MKDDSKQQMGRGRPPRLHSIFQKYNNPIYFITICTAKRMNILNNEHIHNAFVEFAKRGYREKGIAIGRYVIMPEHIHVFARLPQDISLAQWGKMLKRALMKAFRDTALGTSAATTGRKSNIWQRGFFDHLMRNSESYSEKWKYVQENPVRAGLVDSAEEWPYQGEIVPIDYG